MGAVFESFVEKADVLVAQLSTQHTVDLQEYFFKYTMDSFGKIAFNASFNTLEGEPNEYGEAFDVVHTEFLAFFQKNAAVCELLALLHDSNPIRLAIEAVMHRTIPELRRFDHHRKVLERYTAKVINDRRNSNVDEIASKDILGLFIKAIDEEGGSPRSKAAQDIAGLKGEKYLTDVVSRQF